jgi:uncharacterized membrane protein (GlpM family)
VGWLVCRRQCAPDPQQGSLLCSKAALLRPTSACQRRCRACWRFFLHAWEVRFFCWIDRIKEELVYTILKVGISALLIVGVAEASKRSTLLGGLLASLPLTSLLALIWLYRDTQDVAKVRALSTSIFWLVLPSLVLFLTFPMFLKRMPFGWALLAATICMLLAYGAMLIVLRLLTSRI